MPYALRHVRPDRAEPITTVMIAENGFETYAAGSGIINVLFTWTWFNKWYNIFI